MSPVNHNLETLDSENDHVGTHATDMRRVSMSLAFSPARHRRRKIMQASDSWFKSRFGIRWRRNARGH